MNFKITLTVISGLILTMLMISGLEAQTAVNALINTDYKNVPAEYNILAETEYRKIIDLNGEWDVRLGDNEKWNKVDVPGSLEYRGKLYFKRNFRFPENTQDFHPVINGLGINSECTVKINGIFAGSHSGGFTSFSFDLTENMVKPGQVNLIEIEVDNHIRTNSVVFSRPQPWGWKSYSGIIREIYIELLPKVTLTDWYFDYSFSDDYSVTSTDLSFIFRNFHQISKNDGQENNPLQEDIQEVGYYIEIFNKTAGNLIKSTASTPRFINVHQAVEDTMIMEFRDVDLWTPENPILYKIDITLIKRGNIVIDKITETFGFRDVKFIEDGLYLNGIQTTINGIYRLDQHPQFGMSIPFENISEDLRLIKSLGLNSVRTGPYPNHPYLYTLCDEMGLMVFEEFPVADIPDVYIMQSDVNDQAGLFLEEMINRDRHHPSIMAWGIGSGLNMDGENTIRYIQSIAEKAKSLDKRPVYISTNNVSTVSKVNADLILLDFYGLSPEKIKTKFLYIDQLNLSQPVLIGKAGPGIYPENLGGYLDVTSVAYQSKYFSDLYDILRNDENIKGLFYWSFADWEGDIQALAAGGSTPGTTYFRGLVDKNRIERQAYQYLRARISNTELSPLTIGNPIEESQQILVFSGFGLILALIIALKQHRWFGSNFKRSIIFPKNFYVDVIDKRNMQLWQSTLLAFAISATLSIGVASFCYYFKRDIKFDLIISQFLLSPGVKNLVVMLIWNPFSNILFLTVLVYSLILFNAFIHNIILLFFGISKGFDYSYNITIWAGSHFVFAIPLSMAVYASIQNQSAVLIYGIALILLLIIYIVRYILALRVSYQRYFGKSVIASVILFFIFWGSIILFFQTQYQSFTYARNAFYTLNSQE